MKIMAQAIEDGCGKCHMEKQSSCPLWVKSGHEVNGINPSKRMLCSLARLVNEA
jgi:hypothetical protein